MASRPPVASMVRYNDGIIAVVDKPFGLPTQRARSGGVNLYDLLRREFGYVGLHHRLDTPASGLLVVALRKNANAGLAQSFREHAVRRRYRAAVLGSPPDAGRWTQSLDSKPAVTHFRVAVRGDGLCVLQVELETGRTHQIRRHAAGAGLPLLGDRRHGGAAGRLWKRLALHAEHLAFDHPVTGERIEVQSPVPDDLKPLLTEARRA